MKIEELNEGEYTSVSKILISYWKERGMDYSSSWTKSYLLEGHKSEIKLDRFFVLRDRGVIGVIALVVYEGDLAEIRDLVIKKDKRGEGYGKKLLEFVIDYAQKKNIRKLTALVSSNIKGFYEKFKFKEEGYLKDHFRDGEDLFLMSLKLSEEKQVNLKSQLEKLDVEKATEEKLLSLPIN